MWKCKTLILSFCFTFYAQIESTLMDITSLGIINIYYTRKKLSLVVVTYIHLFRKKSLIQYISLIIHLLKLPSLPLKFTRYWNRNFFFNLSFSPWPFCTTYFELTNRHHPLYEKDHQKIIVTSRVCSLLTDSSISRRFGCEEQA